MQADSLLDAVRNLVLALIPQLAYYVQWEFRVESAAGTGPVTISALPVNPKCPVCGPGGFTGITLWPDASGGYAVPSPGTLVRIGFIDADPSKPAVMGLDPNGAPMAVYLSAPGAAVARVGDTVTITGAELTTATMVAGSTPVTVTLPIMCKITSGSAVVQSP